MCVCVKEEFLLFTHNFYTLILQLKIMQNELLNIKNCKVNMLNAFDILLFQ